jgi:6-phosphogluconolactonase
MAQGTPETVVYVSNAGGKEVFVLAMNRATGALELIEKTPVPGTEQTVAGQPADGRREPAAGA